MIETWMTFIGLLISFSIIPQIKIMIDNKSGKNISISFFLILLFAQLNWIYYGFFINNVALIISNIFSSIFSIIILYLKYKYYKGDIEC